MPEIILHAKLMRVDRKSILLYKAAHSVAANGYGGTITRLATAAKGRSKEFHRSCHQTNLSKLPPRHFARL